MWQELQLEEASREDIVELMVVYGSFPSNLGDQVVSEDGQC